MYWDLRAVSVIPVVLGIINMLVYVGITHLKASTCREMSSIKACRHCGKHFSRGYNLRRHESSFCPMLSNSDEESMTEHTYGQQEFPEDDENEDIEEEYQSDGGMSDDKEDDVSEDDDDDSDDHEDSVWSEIKDEAREKHRHVYEELVQNFLDAGEDDEVAKEKAYQQILPVLQKEARNIYLEKLNWMREMRRDPIHRKVMETKHHFVEEDGFDPEEALEAAVNKRKYLLNRIFEDDEGYVESGEEDNEEDNY